MNLHIIFAQRRGRYEGEFAPEALEVMTEYDYEENPNWLNQQYEEYSDRDEFANVKIIIVEVDQKQISEILNGVPVVKGQIVVE